MGTTGAAGFTNPPHDAYPEAWLHVQGVNVGRAGLAADLDALVAVGISGIQMFQVMDTEAWPGVTEPVTCLTPPWDRFIGELATETHARGLSFTMQNCPGWTQSGGPWIRPADAQRTLVVTRTDVDIGADGQVALDLPQAEIIPCWKKAMPFEPDYREIAVLAFPTPKDDTPEPIAAEPVAPVPTQVAAGTHMIEYAFAAPCVLRTAELPAIASMVGGWSYHPQTRVRIEARVDGAWRIVAETDLPCANFQDLDEARLYVQPYETKRFVLALDETVATAARVTLVSPIALVLQDSSWGEKAFARFFSGAQKDDWRGEAGWTLHALLRRPAPKQDPRAWVKRADVRVLPNGATVKTQLPPGKWTFLRVGHINVMRVNAPAPVAATGWECNKLDPRGARAHFPGYIGRVLAQPGVKGKLAKMILDSWECGSQLWTEHLGKTFETRYGYGFFTNMPAIFGFVIDDPTTTRRFQTDFRRLIGELVSENYYGELGRLARAAGIQFDFETAFGDITPGDILEYYKHADVPMCEFWCPRGPCWCGSDRFKPFHPTVSAARMYGKRRVAAEALTGTPLWTERLRELKHLADRAFAKGVTHMVFNAFPHQPTVTQPPPGAAFGVTIGTAFTRGQTWWSFMPGFTRYLARIGAMLESTTPETDVLWVLSDEVDHRPDELAPGFPAGYNFDFANPDAILNRLTAQNGRVATPEGIAWRVLWMPSAERLRAAMAEKLAAFAEAGVPIAIAERPVSSATLADPDGEAARLAAAVARLAACGAFSSDLKGLLVKTVAPDLLGDGLLWSHRADAENDYWFVTDDDGVVARAVDASIRTTPDDTGAWQAWNAVSGEKRAFPMTIANGRAAARLELPVNGAIILVRPKQPVPCVRETSASPQTVLTLTSGWSLAIPRIPAPGTVPTPPLGGDTPSATFALSSFVAWKDLPGADAETRAFSGTATYKTSFDWTGSTAGATLDLGRVEACARVKLNGREIAALWCEPYRCDLSDALKEGRNDLIVEVTDSWHNRLVYDAALPEAERKTWVLQYPEKDRAYVESGLFGPVTVQQ